MASLRQGQLTARFILLPVFPSPPFRSLSSEFDERLRSLADIGMLMGGKADAREKKRKKKKRPKSGILRWSLPATLKKKEDGLFHY